VLLALPPGGQSVDLAKLMLQKYWGAEAKQRGWVVVSLAAPNGHLLYEPLLAKRIDAVLTRALKQTGVVASLTAVGGISNGGLSAFRVALDNPSRYKAIAVLPGFPPRDSTVDLGVLRGVRVAMWVGENDTSWLASMRATQQRLESFGTNVTLVVVPNSGHIIDVKPAEIFDALEGT
jgi:predicted esterase